MRYVKITNYFILWYSFFKNPSNAVRNKVKISYAEFLKHIFIAGIIFGIVFSIILPHIGNMFFLEKLNVFSVLLPDIGYNSLSILTYLFILIVAMPLTYLSILAPKIIIVSSLSSYILTRKSNFKENLFWSIIFLAPATIFVYIIGLAASAIIGVMYFDYFKVSEILLAYFVLSPALMKINNYGKIVSIASWLPVLIFL